jgi:cytochrome P450
MPDTIALNLSSHEPAHLPPGPSWPAWFQTVALLTKPAKVYAWCHRRYGDSFTLRTVDGNTWVLAASPALVRQLFTLPTDAACAGAANRAIFRVPERNRALLFADADAHAERRRMLMPHFRGEAIAKLVPSMFELALRDVETWPSGEPFALHPCLQRLTLRIILSAVFGIGDEQAELAKLLKAFCDLGLFGSALLSLRLPGGRDADWTPRGKLARLRKRISRVLQAELEARRAAAPGNDLLSQLTTACPHAPLAPDDLRDELLTLLIAGHETSALALTWTIGSLIDEPEALDRVTREVDALWAAEQTPAFDALEQLPYLEAVVHEGLRLHAPTPVAGARRLERPQRLGGFVLPAGTMVASCVSVLHRRPDLYPEPERFRPERFLEDIPPVAFAWEPFGGGARRCLGMFLALAEMKVVLAVVLRRLSLRAVGRRGRAVPRGIFAAPAGGLPVVARPR